MADAPHHRAVRELFEQEVRWAGRRLGLTPQVLFELLHVVTDPRRFAHPMTMPQALQLVQNLWDAEEVIQLRPTSRVPSRVCELLERYRLGRKRILDTALAATLEAGGIHRVATLNGRDFAVFPFLEVVDPAAGPRSTYPSPAAE